MSLILITGGAGFIGGHLSKFFLDSGHDVAIVDNFSLGKRSILPIDHPQLTIHTVSILDKESLDVVISSLKPEVVYHLAAIHHIPTCELDPGAALRTNIEGTNNLLEICKAHQVKRLIFTSSGAIYDTFDCALNEEETPIAPRDIYGITKSCGEDLVKLYANRGCFEAVSCRLFNALGPGETNAHLIPDILNQLKSKSNKLSLGNLQTFRGYIHVKDIAEALFRLNDLKLDGQYLVLNIGNDSEHSVMDLVNIVSEISKRKFEIIQDPNKIRKHDRIHQRADISKLKRYLGWTPSRSVKTAIEEAYQEAFSHG